MSDQNNKAPIDKLAAAYEQMLELVNEALDSAKRSTLPNLRIYLDDAREKVMELGELSREEADKVAGYVERDIKDAAHYLLETGEQLSAWWRFDVQQIEERMLEMFINVADQTKLELEKLADRARQASIYHSGEITGPGTLVCINCGKQLHFKKAGHIPPCAGCKGSSFKRA